MRTSDMNIVMTGLLAVLLAGLPAGCTKTSRPLLRDSPKDYEFVQSPDTVAGAIATLFPQHELVAEPSQSEWPKTVMVPFSRWDDNLGQRIYSAKITLRPDETGSRIALESIYEVGRSRRLDELVPAFDDLVIGRLRQKLPQRGLVTEQPQ